MSTSQTIDTDLLNNRFDLRMMIGAVTPLHKEAGNRELAGPCPKCQGDDRLHVQRDWWFCRRCNPIDQSDPGHDAIGWIRWLHNVTFLEAVAMLDATALPDAPARPAMPAQPKATQRRPDDPTLARLATLHATCTATFFRPDNAGFHYAVERGFTDHVLRTFQVGFHADAMGSGPALVLPYYRGGQIWGLHYRYITSGAKPKYKHEKGSSVAGILFGGHTLATDTPELLAKRTLFITEGELNAMSIWQVAEAACVDVLSLGSESASLTPAAVKHAQKYRACIVWCDKEDVARKHAATIGCAAYWSDTPAGKRDANDLLQTMELRQLVVDLMRRASPRTQAVTMDLKEIGA